MLRFQTAHYFQIIGNFAFSVQKREYGFSINMVEQITENFMSLVDFVIKNLQNSSIKELVLSVYVLFESKWISMFPVRCQNL